jgi:hypothetical protein
MLGILNNLSILQFFRVIAIGTACAVAEQKLNALHQLTLPFHFEGERHIRAC